MVRFCSVCGNKADTLLQTANTIEKSVICWSCYGKIKSFSLQKTFKTLDEIEENEEQVINELYQKAFPDGVIEDFQTYFNKQRTRFTQPDSDQPDQSVYDQPYISVSDQIDLSMITTTDGFEGYDITHYLGIVTGYSIKTPAPLFALPKYFIAEMQDNAIKEAFEQAMQKGANAIVGARIDIDLTGTCLVIGTAVRVKKNIDVKISN